MQSSSSNKNSNNTTNIKCTNFLGNTCLEWLLWKKEWLLYGQNLGVEEIVTKGTYGGVQFSELKTSFKEPTEILSLWLNKNVMLLRKETNSNFFKFLTEDCPWFVYTMYRKPIPIGQTVSKSSKLIHYEPSVAEVNETSELITTFCSNYLDLDMSGQAGTVTHDVITGDINSPVLNNMHIAALAHKLTTIKLQSLNKSKQQLDALIAGDILIPNSSKTFQEVLEELVPITGDQQAFGENLQASKTASMAAASSYGEKIKSCGVHFSKLPQNRRDEISGFIVNDDYHGAYQYLNAHFLQLGAGNIEPFEEECKRYRLQPGQQVREHLDLQKQAFKRLAQTLYLEQKLTSTAGVSLTDIEIPESVIIHNSGEMTDTQILAAKGIVLIPELRRFKWIIDSIASSPRFKSVSDYFASADLNSQKLMTLLRMINNKDISSTGQTELREEQAANPNYAKDITSYISNVKRESGFIVPDTVTNHTNSTNNKKRANDNQSSSSSSTSSTKQCDFHPNSTTHWTSECSKNPKKKSTNPSAKTGDYK